MKKFTRDYDGEDISYCGLDCSSCETYLATIYDDYFLRKKAAEKWPKLLSIKVTPEMINCTGCRSDGIKMEYCESCVFRKYGMLSEWGYTNRKYWTE